MAQGMLAQGRAWDSVSRLFCAGLLLWIHIFMVWGSRAGVRRWGLAGGSLRARVLRGVRTKGNLGATMRASILRLVMGGHPDLPRPPAGACASTWVRACATPGVRARGQRRRRTSGLDAPWLAPGKSRARRRCDSQSFLRYSCRPDVAGLSGPSSLLRALLGLHRPWAWTSRI